MRTRLVRLTRRLVVGLKRAIGPAAGILAVLLLRAVRLMDPDRMSTLAGRIMRRIGPWLPEHPTGRANLIAAFPGKSSVEVENILASVWENLGRVGAEYAHLDRLWDYHPDHQSLGRIEIPPDTIERFAYARDDGKPALVFAAHLANWELPALAAAGNGLDTAILYRQPNITNVANAIARIRAVNMGVLVPTAPEAVFSLARVLEGGGHVGMLVDQHYDRGVDVSFFGRRCKANPTLARLARQFDCPIYGTRAIRLPGHRFRLEVTPEITPARDPQGRIEVAGTMQIITSIIEGWVREHPEQWLWLHRRWR